MLLHGKIAIFVGVLVELRFFFAPVRFVVHNSVS
jgi:hypothetical protein